MTFKTIKQITSDVILELGLVQGSSVQSYTEPMIKSVIQKQFLTLVQKRFWKHLTFNTIHDLDGVTGVSTTSLSSIPNFDDIEWIRAYPFEQWNAFEPLNGEEYLTGMLYRYERIPYDNETATDKLVQFYPVEFTGPVMIRARRYKTEYVDSEIIPFDDIALTHLTVSHILAIEGLTPSAEQRHTLLFDQRYKDLISNEGSTISRYGKQSDSYFTVAE